MGGCERWIAGGIPQVFLRDDLCSVSGRRLNDYARSEDTSKVCDRDQQDDQDRGDQGELNGGLTVAPASGDVAERPKHARPGTPGYDYWVPESAIVLAPPLRGTLQRRIPVTDRNAARLHG